MILARKSDPFLRDHTAWFHVVFLVVWAHNIYHRDTFNRALKGATASTILRRKTTIVSQAAFLRSIIRSTGCHRKKFSFRRWKVTFSVTPCTGHRVTVSMRDDDLARTKGTDCSSMSMGVVCSFVELDICFVHVWFIDFTVWERTSNAFWLK